MILLLQGQKDVGKRNNDINAESKKHIRMRSQGYRVNWWDKINWREEKWHK